MNNTPESAMADAGITPPAGLEMDGKLHRFKAGEDHDANSWYVFHRHDKLIIGVYGCWKRQFTAKWSNIDFSRMSPEDRKTARDGWQSAQRSREAEEAKLHGEARARAEEILENSMPADDHGYLKKKGIKPVGPVSLSQSEQYPDWLALPLLDEAGTVHSLQFIAEDGTKKFLYGGRVQGCFFPIPGRPSGPILICEGYATGATLHAATGWSVVCAMNCGNLLQVARTLRKQHPDKTIVICSDNDQFTPNNPGLEKAKKAAEAIRATVAFPEFPAKSLGTKPTDFNDLAAIGGQPEVRRQVQRAFSVIARAVGDFILPPPNDPSELIRTRYLCRRGSMLFTGPTGIGKSSFIMQMKAMHANALPFMGLIPTKPMVSVIIQAENDDGDIAEMRNGVVAGLKFNEQQRKQFFENVHVHTSAGLTGRKFCEEVVAPLLDLYDPDYLNIDPALSFLGGDVKEQKDVGDFLRQYLNPLVYAHNCAIIMTHHTNKPRLGDEGSPNNGEWAYQGAGSAEWANWARCILSMQSTGVTGVYKLHAGKRGARIGWKDAEDQTLFEKIILHSKENGVICWHEGEQKDLPEKGGRPKTYTNEQVADLLRKQALTTREWFTRCSEELGISRAQFHRLKIDLVKEDMVIQEAATEKWQRLLKGRNPF